VGAAASYASSWRDLRRRSFLSWLAFLAVYAGGIAGYYVMPATELGHAGLFVLVVLLLFLAIAVGAYKGSFRCPRCAQFFFSRGIWQNNFARKCQNCGLPRGAEPGSVL
jgi:hypothetical protein